VRKTFRWEGDRPISIEEDVPSTPHPPPRPHHLDARPRPPRRDARPSRPDGPRDLSVGRRGATAPCFLGGDIYGRRASRASNIAGPPVAFAARTVLGERCSLLLPRKPWTINSGFCISLEFISYYIIREFSRY
jgi:hypothetical protein